MEAFNNPKLKRGVALGAAFFAGSAATLIGFHLYAREPEARFLEQHEFASSKTLTNPLLACDTFSPVPSSKTDDIDTAIKSEVARLKAAGALTEAAVYYRDLNNGPWVGYKERELFIPASLLKLPLLLTYLKVAEYNPSILDKKITYDRVLTGATQAYVTGNEIKVGNSYTVRDLLTSMIVNSDNNAALLLHNRVEPTAAAQTYLDLGLKPPPPGEDYHITVRNYATFFRVLYNASYLSQPASELALSLLTQIAFKDGLVAGMPPGTLVAHKFGERSGDSIPELHDCGIVYHPKYPYMLCVMTKGADFDKLAPAIAEIAKVVYAAVTANDN
jgi:beta-lactamase class A